MTVAEKKRKTLEELASEAGGVIQGIPCPRCGCRFHRTLWTRRNGSSLTRVRLCSRCGREFTSTERADGEIEA